MRLFTQIMKRNSFNSLSLLGLVKRDLKRRLAINTHRLPDTNPAASTNQNQAELSSATSAASPNCLSEKSSGANFSQPFSAVAQYPPIVVGHEMCHTEL